MSGKEEPIELEGEVVEAVRGGFRVKLDASSHLVYCTLSGAMRQNSIRVVPGDRVKIEVTPYDPNRGRITFRAK